MEEERKLGVKDECVTQPQWTVRFCEISILLEVSLEKLCMKHTFLCVHLNTILFFLLFKHLLPFTGSIYCVCKNNCSWAIACFCFLLFMWGKKILHLWKCAVCDKRSQNSAGLTDISKYCRRTLWLLKSTAHPEEK